MTKVLSVSHVSIGLVSTSYSNAHRLVTPVARTSSSQRVADESDAEGNMNSFLHCSPPPNIAFSPFVVIDHETMINTDLDSN